MAKKKRWKMAMKHVIETNKDFLIALGQKKHKRR